MPHPAARCARILHQWVGFQLSSSELTSLSVIVISLLIYEFFNSVRPQTRKAVPGVWVHVSEQNIGTSASFNIHEHYFGSTNFLWHERLGKFWLEQMCANNCKNCTKPWKKKVHISAEQQISHWRFWVFSFSFMRLRFCRTWIQTEVQERNQKRQEERATERDRQTGPENSWTKRPNFLQIFFSEAFFTLLTQEDSCVKFVGCREYMAEACRKVAAVQRCNSPCFIDVHCAHPAWAQTRCNRDHRLQSEQFSKVCLDF